MTQKTLRGHKLLVGSLFIVLGLGAAPASAITAVTDLWNPGSGSDELNLYEIYNDIYGTNFSSTNGAASGLGGSSLAAVTGGMDDLQLNEDGVFTLLSDITVVSFLRKYAGNTQRFGYYTNPDTTDPQNTVPSGNPTVSGGGISDNFHHLFDVGGGDPGSVTDGSSPAAIPLADGPVGFYLNSSAGSQNTFYSQPLLNGDLLDHMVLYQAVALNEGNPLILGDEEVVAIPGRFLMAWEDLPLGRSDLDYNDLVMEINFGDTIPNTPVVPEPATAGLLLMGLFGVALRRRFTV